MWSSSKDLDKFFREFAIDMERLFEDAQVRSRVEFPYTTYTEGDVQKIQVDMPGVAKEDLSVEDAGDSLVLSGERKNYRGKPQKFSFRLYVYGNMDLKATTAELKDGVLTLSVPKKTSSVKINVQ